MNIAEQIAESMMENPTFKQLDDEQQEAVKQLITKLKFTMLTELGTATEWLYSKMPFEEKRPEYVDMDAQIVHETILSLIRVMSTVIGDVLTRLMNADSQREMLETLSSVSMNNLVLNQALANMFNDGEIPEGIDFQTHAIH